MQEDTDLHTVIVHGFNEQAFEAITKLEPLFPIKIQDDKSKIKHNLNEPTYINIFLKKDKQIVGYLLATPQNDAVKELRKDDPLMREDDQRYYIDKVAVLPLHRDGYAFVRLVDALLEEMGVRGFNRLSSHILSTNGLHKTIKKIWRKYLTDTREISLAMHDNAHFEYMEFTYIRK